jgi:hypothetical protein
MVERAGDLRSDLVELIGRDVEIFMGRPKLFAGLLKGSAGRLAEPECPHELQACQLARLVPFPESGVFLEPPGFRRSRR